MAKVIALVSKSKRLLISLHKEDCNESDPFLSWLCVHSGFSISDDLTSLLFHTSRSVTLSSIHFQLNTQRELIHSYEFPCHPRGRMNSVRVDAIYQTVFGESERIEYVTSMYPDYQPNDGLELYFLRVKLNFGGVLSDPKLMKINSVLLTFDSGAISFSKEVLGISSEFFLKFLYGKHTEGNSGCFRIKRADDREFTWLIDFILERKWNLNSAYQSLSMLSLADRFRMQNVAKRIMACIMTADLDTTTGNLKYYFDLAVRFSDHGEFVHWIFEKCKTSGELTEVAMCSRKNLTPHLDVFFKILVLKQSEEEKNMAETEKERHELKKKNIALIKEKRLHYDNFRCIGDGITSTETEDSDWDIRFGVSSTEDEFSD